MTELEYNLDLAHYTSRHLPRTKLQYINNKYIFLKHVINRSILKLVFHQLYLDSNNQFYVIKNNNPFFTSAYNLNLLSVYFFTLDSCPKISIPSLTSLLGNTVFMYFIALVAVMNVIYKL